MTIKKFDLVREKDGRHVGRVVDVNGVQGNGKVVIILTVRWNDTKWLSDLALEDVVKISR